jgi:hypothetical protein
VSLHMFLPALHLQILDSSEFSGVCIYIYCFAGLHPEVLDGLFVYICSALWIYLVVLLFCLALCLMCYCSIASVTVFLLGRWSNEFFAGLHPGLSLTALIGLCAFVF